MRASEEEDRYLEHLKEDRQIEHSMVVDKYPEHQLEEDKYL